MPRTSPSFLVAVTFLSVVTAQNDLRGVNFAGSAFSLSSATGVGGVLGATGHAGLNSMARIGATLVSMSSSGNLVAIDPTTGAGSVLVATSPALTSVRGLATAPSGVLYAIQNGSSNDLLYTIDPATGVATLVGTTSHPGLQGLTADLSGTLYSWDVGSGSGIGVGLVVVDPITAASFDVNPAVGNAVDIQCLVTSPAGVLYGARNSLFTLDAATGIATLVGTGGYTDLRGIEFVAAAACSVFNGTGINPVVCNCASLPVLGTTWSITVTPAPATVLTIVFLSLAPLPVGIPLFGGEALIAPPVVDIGNAGLGAHPVVLPGSSSLVGLPLYGQGLRLNATPAGLAIELTNGLAGTLGY